MAVIGASSFFVVKFIVNGCSSKKRLGIALFITAWVWNILTALAVGIEIGVAPMVGTLGGITVTLPSMLLWYVPTGLIEALFTVSLVLSLSRVSPTKLLGLSMLCESRKNPSKKD